MGKNKLIRHNDGTTSCPNCGDSDHECLAPTEPQHTPTDWELQYDVNDIHLETSINKREVEVYVGGWFLCSVDILNISPEAGKYLFKNALAQVEKG